MLNRRCAGQTRKLLACFIPRKAASRKGTDRRSAFSTSREGTECAGSERLSTREARSYVCVLFESARLHWLDRGVPHWQRDFAVCATILQPPNVVIRRRLI